MDKKNFPSVGVALQALNEAQVNNKLAGLDWPAFFDELGLMVDDYVSHSGDESIIDCSEKQGVYYDENGNQRLTHTIFIEQEEGETTVINISVYKKQKWIRKF
ncbi:MAG: hypothetical protein K6B45_06025 [Bacteroidaceae bacterium]|nr:hypothetical protein [Bacteroidaceae bacterium]